jgi:putative hydrolase of the HAD superfamily
MKYKHIFFDLDHTLWDFDKNSAETLQELFVDYKLDTYSEITKEQFAHYFTSHNHKLWDNYNKGLITREEIRKDRFKNTFNALNIGALHLADQIGNEYLRLCPAKKALFPFAHEVLGYLKEKYVLHIITNGFHDIQDIKMTSSGLNGYFVEVITSERAGYKKPEKQIFDYAVSLAKARYEDCIMVGDNLETDIIGARMASLDQVFFNPLGLEHVEEVTHEIKCLGDLKSIF